jgi:DNA polymerase III epsilon subunit-like protein
MTLISVDLETTGTDPDRHEAWEIGLVTENEVERFYEFPVSNLETAEPAALQISNYYERHKVSEGHGMALAIGPHADDSGNSTPRQSTPKRFAMEIARITCGAQLMGCAVAFDMAFLRALLLRFGVPPAWHHRGLDLGSYVAGALGRQQAMSSRDMRELVPNDEVHTALGDARWNWKVYRGVVQSEDSG